MNGESLIDRTPAVVRRGFWNQRLLPYRDILLWVRSLVMWENGFLLAAASIGIHVALYLLFELINHSTFFGLFFSALGSFFPLLFFARKADFLKHIQRQPRPDDNVHYEALVNSAAECDALVDWARAQIHERIDTVNPLAIIAVTFGFSVLGALFNLIPTFYVFWFLAQGLLFAPGCYVYGFFHRARVFGEHAFHAAVPLVHQLAQKVSASVRAALNPQQQQVLAQQPPQEQPPRQHFYRQNSQQIHREEPSYIPVPPQTVYQPHFEQPDPIAAQFLNTEQYQQFPSPLPPYLQPSIVSAELGPEFLALLSPEDRRANGLD